MAEISVDLRRRLLAACLAHRDWTHATVASLFGVDEGTVKRLIGRYRETGDVLYRNGGYKRRRIDRDWLTKHLEDHPDARLVDRINAWAAKSGRHVSLGTMSMAVRDCGWVFVEGRWLRQTSIAAPMLKRAHPSSQ